MSFKSTFLLFGVLIGVLWILGLTLEQKKGGADEGYVLPSLHDEQGATIAIDRIDIDRGGKKNQFVRSGTGWKLSLPPGKQEVRAEDFKVERIIEQVKDARKNDEADVTRNLAKFGLEFPSGKVTLQKKGGGKEWTLNLGNESPDKLFVYVNSSDRPRDVMAVRASTLDSVFFKNANDLRSRTLLDVTDLNAQAVHLKEPKGKDGKPTLVSLQKTDQGGWRFAEPPYGAADFEGTAQGKQKHEGVKDLLNAIGALRVDASDDFEPLGSTRPLKDFGLEEGQEKLRIQVGTATGFGDEKEKTVRALLVGDKAKLKEKEYYYVRVEGESSVARIDVGKLEPIFKVVSDPKTLRSYDLAQIEPNNADAIDLTQGKDILKLRRPEPMLWKIFSATDIPRKANTSVIDGLIAALQGKRQIKEFFDARGAEEIKKLEAKLGLDNPAAEVKVWANALVKEQPKEAKKEGGKDKDTKKDQSTKESEPKLKADVKPVLTLRFGKTDKGLVYVKREAADGTVSWLAVPRDILQKVAPANGVLAFLDPAVPGFPAADVTKLDLLRGPEKFEVVRDKEPKQEWILKEPKDLPNRTAADANEVDRVLRILANLTARKWVKKVDPKDAKALGPFGLDTAALTFTATVKKTGEDKGEGEAHVFKFGKDAGAADQPGVYAIQGNSDLVFVVDQSTVKELREAELRDRTVFKFDAEKVKEIKIAVRKDKEGVKTPVFERNAETRAWVIKAGLEDFTLDEAKVDELVHMLAGLRAERFVSFKGPPRPEFKLGDMDAALRVEVVMNDGKTKHELTVGAAKDKTGYYAQGNSLPGVVFLVPYADFAPLVAGINHFSKNAAAE